MYAVVRESQLRSGQESNSSARQEFAALRRSQPGSRGGLTIDTGNGHLISIVLWESQQDAEAARPTMTAAMERLILPELTGPPEIIQQGTVISNDISR